jgi:hypothetical protein
MRDSSMLHRWHRKKRLTSNLRIRTGLEYYVTVIQDLTRIFAKLFLDILLTIAAAVLGWRKKD